MDNGVNLPDMRQEFIAQSFPFGSVFYQSGNIIKLNNSRNNLFSFDDFSQYRQTLIRHFHYTDIRLDGAERIIGRFGYLPFEKGIKEGRLAHIRQPDDSDRKI